MPAETKTTPAERIAEAIAEAQPCTCGEAGRCPCCTFDEEGAVEIVNRELRGRDMNATQKACIKVIDELMSWDPHAAEDPTTSLGYAVEILRAAIAPMRY